MTLTLELGGTPRTFHFGTGFISNSLEAMGEISLTEMFEELGRNPFKVTPILMYESYKFNLWLKDQEPDCTKEQFMKWVLADPDFEEGPIGKWIAAFQKARDKHLPKEEVPKQKSSQGKSQPARKKK